MSIDTLEDLYLEQLKDIYSASQQVLDITRTMANAATDPYLTKALISGADGIQGGIIAIEKISKGHDERLEGGTCRGLEALVKEAYTHVIEKVFCENAVRDAMIIAQYQRLVHYSIAGYGYIAAFADRLELDRDIYLLKECLDVSHKDDRVMTRLAAGRTDTEIIA
ncbi:DUF892 family protein [Aestuariibius insulae]|uniref:DUF892 family protein n=1 Tax=Aestuariibius insulae TaxID=2058287 RepID=UPI00345EDF03